MLLDVTRGHHFNFLNIVTVTWLKLELCGRSAYVMYVQVLKYIYSRTQL